MRVKRFCEVFTAYMRETLLGSPLGSFREPPNGFHDPAVITALGRTSRVQNQPSRYTENKVLFSVPCVCARETLFFGVRLGRIGTSQHISLGHRRTYRREATKRGAFRNRRTYRREATKRGASRNRRTCRRGTVKGAPHRRQTGRRRAVITTFPRTRAVSPAGYARGMFFLRLFY